MRSSLDTVGVDTQFLSMSLLQLSKIPKHVERKALKCWRPCLLRGSRKFYGQRGTIWKMQHLREMVFHVFKKLRTAVFRRNSHKFCGQHFFRSSRPALKFFPAADPLTERRLQGAPGQPQLRVVGNSHTLLPHVNIDSFLLGGNFGPGKQIFSPPPPNSPQTPSRPLAPPAPTPPPSWDFP